MDHPYVLKMIKDKVSLVIPAQPQFKPFSLDFSDYFNKSHLGLGGRSLLAKAVKSKNKLAGAILDTTGGWARDAFFLAQQGCDITVVEQVELVFRLLQDAHVRALAHGHLHSIVSKLKFIHADARSLLTQKRFYKVIYLDPMFPKRLKSAKVKKDLQILQNLPDTFCGNADELFFLAREAALEKVVVKRSISAPFLAGVPPDFQYMGKTVRFDVYV